MSSEEKVIIAFMLLMGILFGLVIINAPNTARRTELDKCLEQIEDPKWCFENIK